jgi:uncharacterized delta-60 repeat protein
MPFTVSRRFLRPGAVLALLIAWPSDSTGQHVYAHRFEWDGALDQTFPNDSLLFQGMNVWAATTDSSRRIVLVGAADGVFMTARLTPTGALDTTFGGSGIVYTGFFGPAEATAVAIRPNGSILTAGTVSVGGQEGFAVVCHTSTGGICPGLNQGWGTLGGARNQTWFSSDALASSIAVAGDGSFVVAGGNHLARYSPYGTLSASFGDAGKKVLSDAAEINEIALDAEGRIVAAGQWEGGFAVMRFGANGAWDRGFGTNGVAFAFYGCDTEWGCLDFTGAHALAIDGDGRIVVGGNFVLASGGGVWLALTRMLATGAVDQSFGLLGIPTAGGPALITDIRISGADRIWVAGNLLGRAVLARFTYGGNLDLEFLSEADPALVYDGTLRGPDCSAWSHVFPQVVEQNSIVQTGPNTISVVRKAVLITNCILP